MGSFKELAAWKESMQLAVLVYRITSSFPDSERLGLANQLRRSATSVPSNIAEGTGRYSRQDTLRFLYIARGSLNELETQSMIAASIGYINETKLESISGVISSCGKMLNGLIVYYRKPVSNK